MDNNKFLSAKDYLVSGEEFDLLWNSDRSLLRTNPVPDNIMGYYESKGYISHTDKARTVFEKLYQKAKGINLKKKVKLINKLNRGKGVLLDVGAGTGEFMKVAEAEQWRVCGIEPNEGAREIAHKKGLVVYSSLSLQKDPIFDVVTLWHVFEHLPDPEKSARELKGILKADGFLVLALPNFRSLDAGHYKSYWAAYDVPRHLWHFSKDSIKDLFEPLGFNLVSVKPLWLDAFYISWLSEKYSGNRLAPIRGFLWGFLSNLYGIFKKQYSSHIYVLKKTK